MEKIRIKKTPQGGHIKAFAKTWLRHMGFSQFDLDSPELFISLELVENGAIVLKKADAPKQDVPQQQPTQTQPPTIQTQQ